VAIPNKFELQTCEARNAWVNASCKKAHIGSRFLDLADSRKKMENPKEDMPCNCGTFLNNFLIKYEKDQIVLKTLLCAMMKKIEQLEEVQKNHESMGHWYPNHSLAARKPVPADARPASRPQINLVFPQMETLKRILSSNEAYGPPPKQPVHNSQLRAGFLSLYKYNYNRRDYANQNEAKKKENNLKRRHGHNPPPHNEKRNIGQTNHGHAYQQPYQTH
jgi:hypothetical protein